MGRRNITTPVSQVRVLWSGEVREFAESHSEKECELRTLPRLPASPALFHFCSQTGLSTRYPEGPPHSETRIPQETYHWGCREEGLQVCEARRGLCCVLSMLSEDYQWSGCPQPPLFPFFFIEGEREREWCSPP